MEELYIKIKELVRQREDLEVVIHYDTDQMEVACERFLCSTVDEIAQLATNSGKTHEMIKTTLVIK